MHISTNIAHYFLKTNKLVKLMKYTLHFVEHDKLSYILKARKRFLKVFIFVTSISVEVKCYILLGHCYLEIEKYLAEYIIVNFLCLI